MNKRIKSRDQSVIVRKNQNNLNPHLPQWTLWAKPKSQPKPPKKRRPHRGHTLKAMIKK
jgi:hypothetical protein